MSLCLCAEAGVSREDARQGWEVRSMFLLFDGGWSGGAERRFTPETSLPPSLPALGNKRGFFSEEHSDVGGGCECGPCVRAAAAAAAPFVCIPSPTACANPPQLELFSFVAPVRLRTRHSLKAHGATEG